MKPNIVTTLESCIPSCSSSLYNTHAMVEEQWEEVAFILWLGDVGLHRCVMRMDHTFINALCGTIPWKLPAQLRSTALAWANICLVALCGQSNMLNILSLSYRGIISCTYFLYQYHKSTIPFIVFYSFLTIHRSRVADCGDNVNTAHLRPPTKRKKIAMEQNCYAMAARLAWLCPMSNKWPCLYACTFVFLFPLFPRAFQCYKLVWDSHSKQSERVDSLC